MPQLDTIYVFTIYLWTWLMIYLTSKKITTLTTTNTPTTNLTPNKPTISPLWL